MNEKELSKEVLFFCYDFALKNRLKAANIKYVCTAISNDQKRFWLYFKSPKIQEVIQQHVNQQ